MHIVHLFFDAPQPPEALGERPNLGGVVGIVCQASGRDSCCRTGPPLALQLDHHRQRLDVLPAISLARAFGGAALIRRADDKRSHNAGDRDLCRASPRYCIGDDGAHRLGDGQKFASVRRGHISFDCFDFSSFQNSRKIDVLSVP
jgi:hypothetical protein